MRTYKPLRRLCKRCEELYVPESKYSEICQKCNLVSKKKRIAQYMKDKAMGKHRNRSQALQSLAGSDIYVFQPPRLKKENTSYKRVCRDCDELYDTTFKTSHVCNACKKVNLLKATARQKITFQKRIIKDPLSFRRYGERIANRRKKAPAAKRFI